MTRAVNQSNILNLLNVNTITYAATLTPNCALNSNFTVTLTGAAALAAMTNCIVGQSGVIFLVQDSVGGRVVSFNSAYDWENGIVPSNSTNGNAVDALVYFVRSASAGVATSILARLIPNIG